METILVTGATGAMGGAAVKMLRERGYNVIGTSRRDECDGWWKLDISSAESIAHFRERLESEGIRLDGLLNNAGIMMRRYEKTEEGLERTLATNYLGTYRITRALLPLMNQGARVANTVSLTCYTSHFNKQFFDATEKEFSQLGTYGNSKMAVMLFSEELHRRYGDKIRVNVTDPGVVNSKMLHLDRWFDPLADLLFRPFTKSAQQGATPAVNAVTSTCSLQLFRRKRHQDIPKGWNRPEMAKWLWDETEKRFFEGIV